MKRLFRSEYFWILVAIFCGAWSIFAISTHAISLAENSPVAFLGIFSPLGISMLLDLLSPGILPAILALFAWWMRNLRRAELRESVKTALKKRDNLR